MLKFKRIVLLFAALALIDLAALPRPTSAKGCLDSLREPGCMYGLPADQYQTLLAVMGANPAPPAHQLAVDEAMVLRYSDTHTKPARMASRFTGVTFDGPPALPMAWILRTTRPHLLPKWDSDHTEHYVARYMRVYLYATVHADGTDWYLIGPGQWIAREGLAQLKVPANPGAGGRWFAVDVAQQVLTAFEGDRLVFATLISSGKGKRYTRLGLFHIYLRQVTGDMSALMGTPDGYNIYDVPYVMYFDNGEALHGSSWHDNYGQVMSHGCVNMTITDAHWAFDWSESAPDAVVYVWRSARS